VSGRRSENEGYDLLQLLVLIVFAFAVMPERLSAASIFVENSLPGNPPSEWDVQGAGDASIQGFATNISVDHGQTIDFKIKTTAAAYRIDIYRLGYYGGLGARKVATVMPSAPLPQSQPACMVERATSLVDCGNWSVSASWQVPPTATSGIYIAKPVRGDTAGASHIVFIVRDDAGHSDILFQTSDTTWHAYNSYGGINLYRYGSAPPFRAYKVSYNRPFSNRGGSTSFAEPQSYLFDAEYPMLRWLEANGYDVSYAAGVDTERGGLAALQQHKVFLSVGHDEYWSGQQRANVEAAVTAGVHLAFFSGNEVFWKTRWENSITGTNQTYRTLVCYKETHANAKIDPNSAWTGTWRDPRFSPPSDGGRPENSLTGQLSTVDAFRSDPIRILARDGKLRFWRNTGVDLLAPGQVAELPVGVLGFEWGEVVDNGSLPPGVMRLSTTTISVDERLRDYGTTYVPGVATHSLALYRHRSGALVFGAGTTRWSWGLDATHDQQGPAPDLRMQQATVNLLADMGIQPVALQGGLFSATESSDFIAPTSVVVTPVAGTTVSTGTTVTVSGTATDAGGGRPAAVEFSVDGGVRWRMASGADSWSGTWVPYVAGSYTILSRAVDDSGRIETPGPGITLTVVGPPRAIMNLEFEDGSGATAADRSPNGNSGSLRNGPAWTTGHVGGGLDFDGADDIVVVANSSSMATLRTQITVAAWVYRSAAQASWANVMSRQFSASPYYLEHWWLGFTDTGQYRWFVNTTAGYSSTALGGGPAPLGQWVFLVGTYDGAMVRLFVNGAQQFATAHSGVLRTDTTGLTIGASVNDAAQTPIEAFKGRIDQVFVFNVALDATQVQALYAETNPPDTGPPVVTGVTSSTANGIYGVGSTIAIQASFNEPVTVTGTPLLALETGANDGMALYTSGSGTATLTFTYSVASGQNSADLDYVSAQAMALNGGTITDAGGNGATLTLPAPGTTGSLGANKSLMVDGTPPSVPTGLAATPGPGSVALQWTASTDNFGVALYRIYRNGNAVGTSTGTSFQDAGLLPTTTYSYGVAAVDTVGNASARSATLMVATLSRTAGELVRLDFEEGTGIVAGDGSGQVNNGTLLNGPAWTMGHAGGGLSFDGTDDRVMVANSPSIAALSTQITVAAWVYRSAAQTTWGSVVSRQLSTSPYYFDHWWMGFSNTGQYRWFVNTSTGYSSTALGGAAPVGQWVHMVGTYDGAMVRFYVNGVQQFATARTGTLPADTTGLAIGASVNDAAQTSSEGFNGRIDQVRVFNVALDAAQVQALYAGTLP
jgi:hypothetical protein